MKFPQFINTKKRTINVLGTIDDTEEFIDGKGYIDSNGYVWIFCSLKAPENKNVYPYFWRGTGSDNRFEFSDPSDETLSMFHESNLKDLSFDTIIEETDENNDSYDEMMRRYNPAGSSVFVPVLKETDDFLKKIIKRVILDKGTNIERYKSLTPKDFMISNMKQSLSGSTKMSVKYFMIWCEVMGFDFEIIVRNNGKDIDPLPEDLYYFSNRDRVFSESELEEEKLNRRDNYDQDTNEI